MYELYCKHARSVGFSVRKGTSTISKDGNHIEIAKKFVCSSAGKRQSKDEDLNTTKKMNVGLTRTDCKAMMRVKLNNDGFYEACHRSQSSISRTRIGAFSSFRKINNGWKSYIYRGHDIVGNEGNAIFQIPSKQGWKCSTGWSHEERPY